MHCHHLNLNVSSPFWYLVCTTIFLHLSVFWRFWYSDRWSSPSLPRPVMPGEEVSISQTVLSPTRPATSLAALQLAQPGAVHHRHLTFPSWSQPTPIVGAIYSQLGSLCHYVSNSSLSKITNPSLSNHSWLARITSHLAESSLLEQFCLMAKQIVHLSRESLDHRCVLPNPTHGHILTKLFIGSHSLCCLFVYSPLIPAPPAHLDSSLRSRIWNFIKIWRKMPNLEFD